jgi:hypothetical protein
MGRVGDEGVVPPQRDLDLPGLCRPCGLCSGSPLVREDDPANVVSGAVPPVVAVKTAPRLGRNGLDHHPVMSAVVRLRALIARQARRLITNPPISILHISE